jgi:DNA-binding MarR family transcriptional regulator
MINKNNRRHINMTVNTEQTKAFARLCRENKMEIQEYLSHFSKKYIGRMVKRLNDLTEEEATIWITKARIN